MSIYILYAITIVYFYLRQFLCLGDPLMCSGENLSVSCEEANSTSTVPPSPYRLPFLDNFLFLEEKSFDHIVTSIV